MSWTIVGLGSGLAVAGVGLGLTGLIVSNEKAARRDELKATKASCSDYAKCATEWDSAVNQRVIWANVSLWSFVGAGVAMGGTAFYVMTMHGKGSDSVGAVVQIPVYPRGAGLAVSGNW